MNETAVHTLQNDRDTKSIFVSNFCFFSTYGYLWMVLIYDIYIGGFAQFGLNRLSRGKKCCSQLQLSLDTDKLKSCNFVCS